MRDWLTDMAAFTAIVIFLTGAGIAVLVLDTHYGNHSAIVAATERN